MKNPTFRIENLLATFPDKRQEILPYLQKAERYSAECGCAMGAKFMLAAMLIGIAYFIHAHEFGFLDILRQLVEGFVFIFAASIAGKLVGISLAKIKLVRLYHVLSIRYGMTGA